MRPSIIMTLASSLFLAAAGCGSTPESGQGASTATSALRIDTNTTTRFDATYTAGSAWARARVAYTPSTTMFEITTSHGTVIVRTGTAVDGRVEASRPQDPRTVEGVVRVASTDPEFAVISGLLEQLEASGASSHPTPMQAGSTLYAAAYYAARSLGIAVASGRVGVPGIQSEWAYPGYYSTADVPAELRLAAGDVQNGRNTVTCCGPFTCYDADWNPSTSCDDWCAAGDACNAWGWGSCGTASFYPGGGCNSCPHSDSAEIKTYSPSNDNNGSCSVDGWEPGTTHDGPASNFDQYGKSFFGSGGGEYGTGPNDYCCF